MSDINLNTPNGSNSDWGKWEKYVINQLETNQAGIDLLSSKLNQIHTDLVDRVNESISKNEKDFLTSIGKLEEKFQKIMRDLDHKINVTMQNIQNKNDRDIDEIKIDIKEIKQIELKDTAQRVNTLETTVQKIQTKSSTISAAISIGIAILGIVVQIILSIK